jgi:hypothetical protein
VRLGTEVTLLSAYLRFSQPRFKHAQSAAGILTVTARAMGLRRIARNGKMHANGCAIESYVSLQKGKWESEAQDFRWYGMIKR